MLQMAKARMKSNRQEQSSTSSVNDAANDEEKKLETRDMATELDLTGDLD